ncbi:ABC transporter permease [Aliamphritea hakodatensis]|uniref:ABC transporter permease n=1 Tax=Aliamphritea hakodatensis TaxID=2895352 RepID=UPI0022FDA81D|nr:ABC transporter permease subunit [Aliamphritea hakodatensis]
MNDLSSENALSGNPGASSPVSAGLLSRAAASGFALHRIVMAAVAIAILVICALQMRWDWLPEYHDIIFEGLWRTVWLLIASVVIGFLLALPLGLVQVTGPAILASPAKAFCNVIRGTPLLLQLWLLYYGLGSVFPAIPEIRDSWLWPYLRQAWPYALLSLTISFAAYEAEVMRGAFAGVPKGELEAAKAYGFTPWQIFRRIWMPRAIHRALPTLGGEVVLQLKATPLVATITVIDVYGAFTRVRQDAFLTYEPLLLLAFIYMLMAGALVVLFRYLERRIPVK